jgi:cyclophilin family peptidyl-prolyl cis-trans isomerase
MPDAKRFSQPDQVIAAGKSYAATIRTAKGDIVVELSKDTPISTNSFVFLAGKGYYDGLTFHRVEPGFVVQGGDPTGTGSGGPGYTIRGEFAGAVFDEGVLGMARTNDPDSAGSQFFITLGAAHHLDGKYAAFGRVTEGMDVAKRIAVGDVMESITVEEQ